MDRREFLAASAAVVPVMAGARSMAATNEHAPAAQRDARDFPPPAFPVAISSANGLRSVARAVKLISEGMDPLDAAVEGITIVEDDPADNSVGYGGLPNEAGVVELDACAMHGPSHKAGAVAGIQNIKNPGKVALLVLKRTNHVLLVGEGAKQFALQHGFKEEDLLTPESRRAWLRWRENLSASDDRLNREQHVDRDMIPLRSHDDIPFTEGTIHCSAVDTRGDLGGVTSTSGLSYKIPGRVGDSPIIGAGNFTDNLVGSAGGTGRGEAAIKSCAAFQVVNHMASGVEPTEACLRVLKWVANHTRRRMLLNEKGEPNFQLTLYALRKDGAYGSASMRSGKDFAIADAAGARLEKCAYVYE
ncbi:MAG TPA: N(4)-(beta-N-acetylglucosaminyl)-L-asparaginase [Phycisphaerales bacterium]|nr:N(4)-(beta-N-acetylglucosaminyl)-L-asparaginase [Phycisphaerales bacterium]HRQ76398.1 N(4)-(beta-N-acetylglucosaminyl)-L-asparaginase [Phycisphaerales bacterium]